MSRFRWIAPRAIGALLTVLLSSGAVSSGCAGKGEPAPEGEAREALTGANPGQACTSGAGCRSGTCTNGWCACIGGGGACGLDSDCCSPAACVNGTCATCSDYSPYKNAYFGNLHQHTANSLDAYSEGTRAMPADAYAFAQTPGDQMYVGSATVGAGTVTGNKNITSSALYGASGTLNGLTLSLIVNGVPGTLTFSGSGNALNETSLLAAISAMFGTGSGAQLTATPSGVDLSLTANNSGAVVVGSGSANAALGLTASGVAVTQTKRLDFLAVTDHSEWFDLTEGCALDPTPSPYYCTSSSTQFCPSTCSTCPDSSTTCTKKGTTVNQNCQTIRSTASSIQGGVWDNRDCLRNMTGNAGNGDPEIGNAPGTEGGNTWNSLIGAAETAYDACTFTSLVAYEWTGSSAGTSSSSNGTTNHRNVIFRTAVSASLPPQVYDSYNYTTPPDLWQALDVNCTPAMGCEAVTIPHNSNTSNGVSLTVWPPDANSASSAATVLEQQARYQVSAEIYQHKGGSECYGCQASGATCSVSSVCCSGSCVGGKCQGSALQSQPLPALASGGSVSVTYQDNDQQDPACSFEYLQWPFVPNSQNDETPETDQPINYVRGGLESGIANASASAAQSQYQPNPLQLGIVGATDDHNGTAGYVDEWSFVGHTGRDDDTAAARLSDGNGVLQEYGPGGLTGVWAEANTRDRVFAAIQRRETFATSGPRMKVRFYQYDKSTSDDYQCQSQTQFPGEVVTGGGVPMGGTFGQAELGSVGYPTFVIQAMVDTSGQIVPPGNGATSCTTPGSQANCSAGATCCAPGNNSPACAGYPPSFPSGVSADQCWQAVPFSTVQVIKAHVVNGNVTEDAPYDLHVHVYPGDTDPSGQTYWCGTWSDYSASSTPQGLPAGTYDGGYAFYYVRVLQQPTYRWSHWDCLSQHGTTGCINGQNGAALPDTINERAWTSPIWYSPTFQYTVLAGSGTAGYSGDDGQATQAALGSYLSGMAKDAAGNLYIADAGNAVVRKVDPLGVITTFAGTGTPGPGTNSATGCTGSQCVQATASQINAPSGVAVDASGNVYFSEFNNDDIRKVDTQGHIWLYAPLLGQPTGIAMDGSNDLYVAMWARETIVKITPANAGTGGTRWAGLVNTAGYANSCAVVGGAIQAQFSNPNGVWADTSGNVYVNDAGNAVIRKYTVSTGCFTTIAGVPGSPGYSGDNGPAISAQINAQYGVVTDALGDVFIADSFNNVIRMINPGGTITTVANLHGAMTPSSNIAQAGPALGLGLSQPGYAWMDGNGAMYFSDQTNRVFELTH
jgi:Protein of unknown function (DUF3604)